MSSAYTSTAKWLHWLVAVLIFANLALGLTMVDMPGITPTKLRYFNWHKWVGVMPGMSTIVSPSAMFAKISTATSQCSHFAVPV